MTDLAPGLLTMTAVAVVLVRAHARPSSPSAGKHRPSRVRDAHAG